MEAGLNGQVEVAARRLLDLVDSDRHMDLMTTVSSALRVAVEEANMYMQSFANFRQGNSIRKATSCHMYCVEWETW